MFIMVMNIFEFISVILFGILFVLPFHAVFKSLFLLVFAFTFYKSRLVFYLPQL